MGQIKFQKVVDLTTNELIGTLPISNLEVTGSNSHKSDKNACFKLKSDLKEKEGVTINAMAAGLVKAGIFKLEKDQMTVTYPDKFKAGHDEKTGWYGYEAKGKK